MAAERKGKCCNCCKTWPEERLDEVHDFWGRVTAGDEVPLGQCPAPECRGLCYPIRNPHKVVVVVDGGLIQDVQHIPRGVVVEVRDFDVEGTHLETHKTREGEEYVRSLWEAEE